jgi:predicted nucleotidyltransferase
MTDFARLLETLAGGNVEFIIVGGLAATIHGSSRLTQDIDIVYRRSDENIERIVTALRPHSPYLRGAPPGLPFEWSSATLRAGLNFTLTTTVGDIDLFGEIVGGGGFEKLVGQSHRVVLFGNECMCVDLDALIRLKRAAGRPKDLEVLAELEALTEEHGRDPD